MLSKEITIKGSLTPNHLEGVIEPVNLLSISFGNHGLCKMLNGRKVGKNTVVEINSSIRTSSGRHDAEKFIEHLRVFLQAESVAELDLQGSILLTIETENDPVLIRISVQDGNVTCKEARLVWDVERSDK